jgi:hypothetical protein
MSIISASEGYREEDFSNTVGDFNDPAADATDAPTAAATEPPQPQSSPFASDPVPVDMSAIQPMSSARGAMMQADLLYQSVNAYERNEPLLDSFKGLSPDAVKAQWINLYNGMSEAGYSNDIMLSLYEQGEALLKNNPEAAPALQAYMVSGINSMMQRYGFAAEPEGKLSSEDFLRQNLESGDFRLIYNAVHSDQRFDPGALRVALAGLENVPPEFADSVERLHQLADEKEAANAAVGKTDLSEYADYRPEARWLEAKKVPKEESPFTRELLSCRDSINGAPQKLQMLKIDPENPVMIGERNGEPILAKEGFLIEEKGGIRFASEEEVKRRSQEAEEDMKRNGQRPGGILSTLLNKPVTLAMDGLNTAREAIRHQLNPEHLSKWRESRMLHTAEDAKTHLQNARNTLDGIMEHPDIAQLRKARDSINVRDGDLFAEYEKQKINDKIQKTINANPELKQSFDAAMTDVDLAASKHKEFLESARKHNLRPDQLLDMDKVDSKMLEDLKKKMKEIGLRNDSKSFESLEKMGEKIREVVQALVERFKNSFGMKQ